MGQKLSDERCLAILSFLQDLQKQCREEMVVIGGWAVYAHTKGALTGDGDIVISNTIQTTLRQLHPTTRTPQMKKEQFRGPTGDDIDVYVQFQHGLKVDFEELQAFAEYKEGIQVPCLEHLLLLKLEAYKNRRETSKGAKDVRDLIGLLNFEKQAYKHPGVLSLHLEDKDWKVLEDICADQDAALSLSGRNPVRAKQLRGKVSESLNYLKNQSILSLEETGQKIENQLRKHRKEPLP